MKVLTPVLAVLFVLVATLQGKEWDGEQGEDEAVGLCVCGGDFISLLQVMPNPGGKAQKIQGSGKWKVGTGATFQYIRFNVTLKGSNPAQNTYADITTKPPDNTWSITLAAAAATYNPCTATLVSKNCDGTLNQTQAQNTDDQEVN